MAFELRSPPLELMWEHVASEPACQLHTAQLGARMQRKCRAHPLAAGMTLP